jgi:hypothetical protein
MKRICKHLNTPAVLGGIVPALVAWVVTAASRTAYA